MLLLPKRYSPEYIVEESSDWWVCRCGNKPDGDGFASCNEIGERCEPTIGEWDGKHWLCESCYRIIDGDTLQVLGRCSKSVVKANRAHF